MATQNAIGSNKPIEVAFGGTGLSTITAHTLVVGDGASAVTPLAVGATGEVMIGTTGADPSWSATVLATTFDTNVAAAGVTLAGTSLLADGSDGNIDINITAKGTGQVIIDDLQLTTDLTVPYGGTGASTFTDHGVLVGSAAAAITALGVATNGKLIIGSTGADPVVASVASTDGSLTVTEGAGTLVIEGTAAGEAQAGVVELATDAEAIAGTASTVINCTSLKAKLGDQTDHGVLVGSGTTAAITALTVGTDGQVLIGDSADDPVFAAIASADGSIAITGGAGTLDLSASGVLTTNVQTGTTYEFLLTDVGKLITCNNAGAITVTIPVNGDVAMPVGTQVLVAQLGAGVVTLAPEGGVTLRSRGTFLDLNGQYAMCACVKILTDTWVISGDLA